MRSAFTPRSILKKPKSPCTWGWGGGDGGGGGGGGDMAVGGGGGGMTVVVVVVGGGHDRLRREKQRIWHTAQQAAREAVAEEAEGCRHPPGRQGVRDDTAGAQQADEPSARVEGAASMGRRRRRRRPPRCSSLPPFAHARWPPPRQLSPRKCPRSCAPSKTCRGTSGGVGTAGELRGMRGEAPAADQARALPPHGGTAGVGCRRAEWGGEAALT